MNVRLQVKNSFRAMVHYESELFVNQYHVTIDLVTACRDHADQNIAMDRINYMLHEVFDDSVMIDVNDCQQIELYRAAGMRVTTLPAEPVDQIIGLMLYCKMNAICEGRMLINAVSLCSDRGDHVWYLHDDSESVGPFQLAGWWNDSVPSSSHPRDNGETVVNLKSKCEWARLDLDWPSDILTTDGKVVFAKFDRDQDQ